VFAATRAKRSQWVRAQNFMGGLAGDALCPRRSEIQRAATHKVYHFQAVMGLDHRICPLGLGDNLEITLHGDAISRQLQPIEQSGQAQPFGDVTKLSIQVNIYQRGLPVREGPLAEQGV